MYPSWYVVLKTLTVQPNKGDVKREGNDSPDIPFGKVPVYHTGSPNEKLTAHQYWLYWTLKNKQHKTSISCLPTHPKAAFNLLCDTQGHWSVLAHLPECETSIYAHNKGMPLHGQLWGFTHLELNLSQVPHEYTSKSAVKDSHYNSVLSTSSLWKR